jgi:GntR family transcriptional regulator
MTVDPGLPELLHEQLAEVLRSQLLDGTLPPRRKVPTQEELSERYGVSRGTVLRATRQLTQEGLLQWVKGRGLFAADEAAVEKLRRSRAKKR